MDWLGAHNDARVVHSDEQHLHLDEAHVGCPDHQNGEDAAPGSHGHALAPHLGHDDATALALSPQARKNVGLKLVDVELRDFDRTITIPATIVERPGRSKITLSAPMTGVISRIYPIQGEAVVPGQPLFDLRLTHEDLVEKQSELLKDMEQLDVIKREVGRLQEIARSGAVAGKTLLERQYEQQKLEAAIRAETQALRLHGLSEEQIAVIAEQRELLQSVAVLAPTLGESHGDGEHEDFLQLQEISVNLGDHVTTGTRLATLADHCELYIEGQAFETDADTLHRIADQGIRLAALVEDRGSGMQLVPELRLVYVGSQIEIDSRVQPFYVELPNELISNKQTREGRRFISWRFRPGQRVELRVPVERWRESLVIPIESVVQDGVESYVFEHNQDHFDRLPVHVLHRDRQWVVIERDGTLAPGDVIAGKGAYQIHLALKNKAQPSVDAHAGHAH
jgi:multidrug efflux pump subunit AcrA (membrane-fusion protein)